nr:hypothetical protein [uncultured Flavobacterium sp.]
MANNFFISASSTNLASITPQFKSSGKKNFDNIRIIYEYLFSSEDSLKEKNKYLILFLQHHIQNDAINIVNKFLSDCAIRDLHASLLKSSLIMIQNVDELNELYISTEELLNSKL